MVKQFLSSDLERENAHNCFNCSEPITNPICHDCLTHAVFDWLNNYPNIKKMVSKKIKSYKKKVDDLVIHSINCVSCNKKKAALCPYCFTEGVYNLLKKANIDQVVLGDFLSIFNFDLKHEGYIQDAIDEGLY